MRASRPFVRYLRATAQTATLLGLLTLGLTWAGIAFYLGEQREQASNAATQNMANLARAFEEQIVQTVRSVDQALLFIRTQYQQDPSRFDLDTWGKTGYYTSDVAIQLAFIGADGFMVSSNVASSQTPSRIDLSDREHFRVHANTPKDELFISKPVLGRVTNKWTIQLTRKIFQPDGSFGGVLVASLDPSYLSRFYDSIDIGRGGAVTVIGRDGVIRARGGQTADVLGKEIRKSPLLEHLEQQPSGTYVGTSGVDGINRLVAYRSVRALPLVVTVAASYEDVFRTYRDNKVILTRSGQGLTLVILAAMLWSVFQRLRLDTTRRELLDKSQALGLTLASMSEGILMVNAEEQVVVINEQGRRLLGMDNRICPFPLSQLMLQPAGEETKVVRAEAYGRHVTIRDMQMSNGQILEIHRVDLPTGGFVMTLTDITQRKAEQREIEEARDRAEAASRARGAFLATMSHEIRTPLSGVISMADLLSETNLDRDQRWYTHVARESAEHLLQLLDDILDISKFEAGRLTLETISFELPHVVQNVLEMLGPKARTKALSIGSFFEPTLPRRVVGDPGRLRQILINLVGNAVKFTVQGHVMVRVTRVARQPGQTVIRFEVEDTGIGISPEGLSSLFQDFSQLDSTISRRFGGSGLGLSICKKLVTKMGGDIEVRSEFGKGTVFSFDLPLMRDENSDEFAIRSLPGCAVAVIADNEFDRDMLVAQLTACGATTGGFKELEAAGDWLDRAPLRGATQPVLVCVGSPPGIEQWRRSAEEGCCVPRKLLIGTGELAIDRDYATRAGFDDVLVKPVSSEAFADVVHQLAHSVALPGAQEQKGADSEAGRLPYRILLAEDNATNQFALTRMLDKLGASVTVVDDGQKAVRAVQQGRFDLVLMDMMMPVMDGLAAARRIRGLPAPVGQIPIIALTANAFPEDREATRLAGMNGFATKPTTAARLSAAIREVMGEAPQMVPPLDAVDAEPQDSSEPIVDSAALDVLRTELGEDEFREALDIFFDDIHQRLTRMLPNDARSVQSECHAMKSSSAMFGLAQFASRCAALEASARSGRALAGGGVEELRALLERAQRDIQAAA